MWLEDMILPTSDQGAGVSIFSEVVRSSAYASKQEAGTALAKK